MYTSALQCYTESQGLSSVAVIDSFHRTAALLLFAAAVCLPSKLYKQSGNDGALQINNQ